MLVKRSRLALPSISRWVRMNSGGIKGPSSSTPLVGLKAEPKAAEDGTKDASPADTRSAPQEMFASLVNKTRLSAQPIQSQLSDLILQNIEADLSHAHDEHIPEQITSLESNGVSETSLDGTALASQDVATSMTSVTWPTSVDSPQAEGSSLTSNTAIRSSELEINPNVSLSPSQQALLRELAESCQSQAEFDEMMSSPDLEYLLSLQQLKDVADIPEPVFAALPIPGKGLYPPVHHETKHRIPAATITFKGHDSQSLILFTHFAVHAASALGIPTSKVYALPKQRRLWTVLKSPFVYKKSQENFERITHSRGIKAWDADPKVVNIWTAMLRQHAMPGVGMRVVKWSRMEVGGGSQALRDVEGEVRSLRVGMAERVRALGDQIVEKEMAAAAEKEGAETTAP